MSGATGDVALTRRLVAQARPWWPHLAGLTVLSLLAAPFALLAPLPIKIAVDSVLGGAPLPGPLRAFGSVSDAGDVLLVAAALTLVVAAIGQLQAGSVGLLSAWIGERLVLDLQTRLFRHAERLALRFHDMHGTTHSLYAIQYDAPAIQYVTIDGLLPFVSAALTLAGMVYVTARLDWQLAAVALLVAPVLFAVLRRYRIRTRRGSLEAKRLQSHAFSAVQQALSALRVVRAFQQEEREVGRFAEQATAGMQSRMQVARAEAGFGLVTSLVMSSGMAAVLYLGVAHVRSGRLSLGDLLLVIAYLAQLYDPLRTVSRKVVTIQSSLASAERAFALLDEAPEALDRPDARPLARAVGRIAFEDVTFAHDGSTLTLKRASFKIEPGTSVGISGPTGGGKTTLLALMARLLEPQSGRVLLDGVDVRELRVADLRRQFAFVLQDALLLSGTIAENIAYGRPDAAREEITAAAQAAGIHAFVESLPEGYDTKVGERGMRLSGGERQRIGLARALVMDAPIILMDEPTSSLDAEAESSIIEALDALRLGRTVVIVSHREAVLARCDVRLHLQDGEPLRLESGRRPGRRALREHPAVRAWRELDPANAEPRAVQRLRPDATALTYRLEGAAPDGRSVLARFLTADDFARQYTVYRRVLPRLPVTKVYCYGSHAEPDGSGWLFLEDFGAAPVTGERAGYRYAVSRWIARVHVESVQVLAAAGLHGSDASDYLDRLHSAVAKIDRHLRTPALPRDERLGLQALIRTLESIADGWAEIEDECVELPRTLVHGGLRSDTVAVTEGATGLEVRVLDWGTAGWGIPAVDLRDVDLGVYREAIRDEWPELRGAALLRMKELGVFFDALTSIDRAASRVPFPWSRRFPPLRLHGPERGATLAERRDIA